jgi:hypothetical protein
MSVAAAAQAAAIANAIKASGAIVQVAELRDKCLDDDHRPLLLCAPLLSLSEPQIVRKDYPDANHAQTNFVLPDVDLSFSDRTLSAEHYPGSECSDAAISV